MKRDAAWLLVLFFCTLGLLPATPLASASWPPNLLTWADRQDAFAPGEEPAPSEAWRAPKLNRAEISLLEAIELTLEHSPNLRLQRETTLFQAGLLKEAVGQFDPILTTDLSWDYARQELRATTKQRELEARELAQDEVDNASAAFNVATVVLDEVRQLRQDPTGFRVSDADIQATIDLINLEIASASPADRPELLALREQALADAERIAQEQFDELLDEFGESDQSLRNLGAIPEEEENYFGRLNSQYLIPTRRGLIWGPFAEFTLDGDRYIDKRVDEDFGGKGIKDVYRGTLGFTVDAPLLRDRGREGTGAFETAAEIDYAASLDSLRHAAAAQVLETTLAYWTMVGVEERVAILQRSAETQQELVDLTQALIDADELPASEIAQVKARQASSLAALEEARRAVREARLGLAMTLGLHVDGESKVPMAAHGFPEDPATEATLWERDALQPWVEVAEERRQDLAAARKLEESGGVLLRAAEIGLRPRLDFGGRFFYNALAESSGNDALTGRWVGPSYSFSFDLDWPFANNAQEGRHLQASASQRSRQIEAAELGRQIRSNVLKALASLDETVLQIGLAAEAVEAYESAVEAEVERLRYGASTVVDTLLTEQRLTEAQLAQTAARRQYAQLLAQLRFETGTLVEHEEEASRVDEEDLFALPTLADAREGLADAGEGP